MSRHVEKSVHAEHNGSNSKTSEYYLDNAQFESRPGYWLYRQVLCGSSSCLQIGTRILGIAYLRCDSFFPYPLDSLFRSNFDFYDLYLPTASLNEGEINKRKCRFRRVRDLIFSNLVTVRKTNLTLRLLMSYIYIYIYIYIWSTHS